MGMKANKNNPDLPTWEECMSGEHQMEAEQAIHDKIFELSEHNTWNVVPRSSVPEGARVLPSTWAFCIKRYPDGRFQKFKARFCVRGNQQVEGVNYDKKYSPVVAWSTVQMMMSIAATQDLQTRQVDFSNAFVQAALDRDVYVALPRGFGANETGSPKTHVLKLNKSLYGLVQAPMYWNNHLVDKLEENRF